MNKNTFTLIFCLLLLGACQSSKDSNEEHDHRESATTASEDETQSKKSISKETHAQVGDVHIAINYHSPAVRGRVIWGGLVPYDEVWVTGAHRATSMEFSKAIKIEGTIIPKGKYAFFTIPGNEQWTLILNRNWDQHLADDYDASEDIVTVNITPETGLPLTERLVYVIKDYGEGNGAIIMQWENLSVSLRFNEE